MLYGLLELFSIFLKKNHWNCFKYNMFCFHKFFKFFFDYLKLLKKLHKYIFLCLHKVFKNFSYNWKSELQNLWNYSKITQTQYCIVSIIFPKHFLEYIRAKNPRYKIAWNHLKISWSVLNTIFFNLKNFLKHFRE